MDPLSVAKGEPEVWEFYYDEKGKRVKAKAYEYDMESGTKGAEKSTAPTLAQVDDRLEDIIDYHIIVDTIDLSHDGKLYYRNKANGTVRVDVSQQGGYNVSGGYQIEREMPIHVTLDNIKDQTKEGNGKTYIVPDVMMTSLQSAYSAITAQAGDEANPGPFYEFHKLMGESGAFYVVHHSERGGSSV